MSGPTQSARALARLLRTVPAPHPFNIMQGPKLLIVDDSAQMRRLMRTMFEDIASEVRECCGGTEAVAAYFESHPDWVLMDLQMPDGDGLTATREIRSRDDTARILIVTQFDQEELRHAAAEAGAIGYALKENLLGIRGLLLSGS